MHLQTWSFSPTTVETNSIRKIFAPLPPDSLSCHYQAITVCCLVSCVFSGCFNDDIKSARTEYNTVPRETSWSSCFRLEPGYFSMMGWMAWRVRGEHWMLFILTLARLLSCPSYHPHRQNYQKSKQGGGLETEKWDRLWSAVRCLAGGQSLVLYHRSILGLMLFNISINDLDAGASSASF